MFDRIFYLLVAAGAVALAALGLCAADWAFALATVLVAAFWAWTLYRKTSRSHRNERRQRD